MLPEPHSRMHVCFTGLCIFKSFAHQVGPLLNDFTPPLLLQNVIVIESSSINGVCNSHAEYKLQVFAEYFINRFSTAYS